MKSPAHETHSTITRRHGRRRDGSWLNRPRGNGFTTFRMRQLVVLGAAMSLLVALADTGAQAGQVGPHGGGGHLTAKERRATAEQRRLEAASLRALRAAQFNANSGHFGGRHHGHPLPDPTTTTTLPPATTTTLPPATTTTVPPAGIYPVGVTDATEPSGMAPPDGSALAGYNQSYVTDFAGSTLPSGWEPFTGNPGGDPGAQWSSSHVTVSGGMLNLNTWKDPAYGNEWVTGGLCQCGVAQTYGAYFVRSRVTGPGPSQVELLWPTGNRWPPEIDFDESSGTVNLTTATLHFGSSNKQDQRSVNVDLTQWHTWGVIWTPDAVTYTVDGRVWGSVHVASEISAVPMTLDLTQQTWCSSFWACPTAPQTMQVDWVAEYTAS